ncbi:LysR family transcriptional regulator [Sphaerisporangium krabiense]|uniref:Molybdate transport repressor ModE-like protein n=1 Tax=Sphaerisporangium krabiense TaxID=763782 RepID=A0A7W8YZA8_9ACTN|nr:LysR family transcriptional regulator [Sphaerisporangium krabiense]MBB5624556.1 molybdate transport repressor ModE-like protein [Sphaerisporangium krabiense]GII61489.1 LysR family transcriptional regulator [Sphaerisporangium krabiense]
MLDILRLRVLDAVARTGSVTAAARELNYSQPSVSHHLARLEAETGAVLIRRAGRGVRLTEAGRLLADRAAEIIGRLDSASAELAAHVGMRAGRVRLAAFPSALGTFVPAAAVRLARAHPGLDLRLAEAEPPEALAMLRAGRADVAVTFHHGRQDLAEDGGVRLTPLFEDPTLLVTAGAADPAARDAGNDVPAAYAGAKWIAGCDRCRGHLLDLCAAAGFEPAVAFTTDDYVAVQAMVAAGLGVTVLPALALSAHRHPGVRVTALPGASRRVFAATYGEPPDPPATTALLEALREAAAAR